MKVEPNPAKHQQIIFDVCKKHNVKSLELTDRHIAIMDDCITAALESNPPTQVGEDVYNSLRYAVEIIKAFAENFSYDHDLDASVKKMERILQSQTSPPAPEELTIDELRNEFQFFRANQTAKHTHFEYFTAGYKLKNKIG